MAESPKKPVAPAVINALRWRFGEVAPAHAAALQGLQQAIDRTREEVDASRARLQLNEASPESPRASEITKESANLQALAIRELTTSLEKALAEYTLGAKLSSDALVWWTRVMAAATAILAAAAVVQAVDILVRWGRYRNWW